MPTDTGTQGNMVSPLDSIFSSGTPANWAQALQGFFGTQQDTSKNENVITSSTVNQNTGLTTQQDNVTNAVNASNTNTSNITNTNQDVNFATNTVTGQNVINNQNVATSQDTANQIDQILKSITQMQQNQTGKTTSAQSKESAIALQTIQSILPTIMNVVNSPTYTKEQAIKDSQGQVSNIMQTLKEQALPGVFSAEAASGGYKSTTKQLLSNDLAARAVGQANAAVSSNVASYANIQQNQVGNLLNLINSTINAQQNVTGAQDTSNTTTGTTTTDQGSSSTQTGKTTGTSNTTGNTTTTGTSATTGNQNTAGTNTSTGTSNTTGSSNTTSSSTGTQAGTSTTNTQGQQNTATTAQQNTQGLASNPGAQAAAAIFAGINAAGGINNIANAAGGFGAWLTNFLTGGSGGTPGPAVGETPVLPTPPGGESPEYPESTSPPPNESEFPGNMPDLGDSNPVYSPDAAKPGGAKSGTEALAPDDPRNNPY